MNVKLKGGSHSYISFTWQMSSNKRAQQTLTPNKLLKQIWTANGWQMATNAFDPNNSSFQKFYLRTYLSAALYTHVVFALKGKLDVSFYIFLSPLWYLFHLCFKRNVMLPSVLLNLIVAQIKVSEKDFFWRTFDDGYKHYGCGN